MTAKFLSQMPDLWRWHLHQLDVGRQKMTCNYRTKHDSNDKMFLLKMYAITWTTWDTSHRQKATRVKDIQCDFITTVKFIFSEKATKFCEISTLLLSVCTVDKSKVIREKSRSGRFLWNRNWDLGWIWASWHYRKKKIGPIMSNFWGRFFHVFMGKKMFWTFLKIL